jgi:hypothetical protein
MTPDLKALRVAAERASGGPWSVWWSGRSGGGEVRPENRHYCIYGQSPGLPGYVSPASVELCSMTGASPNKNHANATFIASCDPQTVIWLLDRARRAEALERALQAAMKAGDPPGWSAEAVLQTAATIETTIDKGDPNA